MRVHNLMKDLVVQKVEELLADPETQKGLGASLEPGSQDDIVCYVLNRTPPRYAVSGRGVAHHETQDFQAKAQQLADITRLAREGLQAVAAHRRLREGTGAQALPTGPYYNLPSIIGRMFNGLNFEPVHDVTVGLYLGGALVEVADPNWQNPYRLVINTAGTFLFWPRPVAAEAAGDRRRFDFEVRVDDPRFEPLHYFFTLEAQAEPEFIDFVNMTASTRLKDLYLFPRD